MLFVLESQHLFEETIARLKLLKNDIHFGANESDDEGSKHWLVQLKICK